MTTDRQVSKIQTYHYCTIKRLITLRIDSARMLKSKMISNFTMGITLSQGAFWYTSQRIYLKNQIFGITYWVGLFGDNA